MSEPKRLVPPHLVRDARAKVTVRSPDGARFEASGQFPNRVAFGIYMLACDWGDGVSHKPLRSKRMKDFEAAAKAFLDASEKFYDTIDGHRSGSTKESE